MERKYKSQGRQLLEDLPGLGRILGSVEKVIKGAEERQRKDPKAVETTKLGTLRNKSIRKGTSKVKATQMDKERTDRIKLRKLKRGKRPDKVIYKPSPHIASKPKELVRPIDRIVDKYRQAIKKTKKPGGRQEYEKKASKRFPPLSKGYKKGGAITYRMTGGQVVDNSYD